MLLTVGKLTARKRTADVLLAVARIGDRCGQPIVAVLVGDGPERSRLEALAKTIGHHRVRMLGFVNTDKLADYYVASDILVHPSQEDPHPLATSEAVFCGLPVVASDRVGSVGPTDDVRPGENGRQYPVGNIDKLAGCIELLAMDESLRSELSSRSREIGRERSLQVSVDGFVRAVQTVCGHTSKPS
jgi:glycosyltransferase involved in cell wall biosynthesis